MAAPRVNRRLAAIMAVDVVGYSGLVGEDDASAIARLLALRKSLVEPLIDRIPRPGRRVDGRRRAAGFPTRLPGFPPCRAGAPDRWLPNIRRGAEDIRGARRAADVQCPGPRGQVFEERRRLARVVMDVVGHDCFADHGLRGEADHQGKQSEHRRHLRWRFGGDIAPEAFERSLRFRR